MPRGVENLSVVTVRWLCSLSGGDEYRGACGQSVIRNLVVWHVMRYAYYGYPGYNYVFDHATVDPVMRHSSFYNTVGVYPPYWRDGTVRFEHNFLKTQAGLTSANRL